MENCPVSKFRQYVPMIDENIGTHHNSKWKSDLKFGFNVQTLLWVPFLVHLTAF